MFKLPVIVVLAMATSPAEPSQLAREDILKRIYPLAPAKASPIISVDASEAPDLLEWGNCTRDLANRWFPHLTELLSTQDAKYPKSFRFKFRLKQDAPAYCTGDQISVSAPYVRAHPKDVGMLIHEITHLVQSYPDIKVDTGWLVEGIADYVRWWRFEPEAPRSRIDFTKATYHDAYRTTAAWLAWVSQKYDSRLVPALDLNLRRAEDPMPTFEKITGKGAQALWDEFRLSMEKRG